MKLKRKRNKLQVKKKNKIFNLQFDQWLFLLIFFFSKRDQKLSSGNS